jgi:glycolate dehydrogenase FAD-linked subunit
MKSAAALAGLARLLKPGELRCEEAVRQKYAGDKWFAARIPDAVALPTSPESVSKILRFASAKKIPVTARGAGFGYVGGCVPSRGGIVLSLERMKRIREIHRTDFVAVVEAGVHTKTLQDAVEELGLFYPPDPASRADCSIGGNIATNAGGPRCLKYGVTRDYVLGLQVVLADGSILQLGSRTHKNKTGFELARLFVGSEGLLGVVTEATLKLLPLPPDRAALSVGFGSMRAATRAIDAIFAAGFLPAAVELADGFTVAAAYKRTGSKRLKGCRAHLIVELDGQPASVRQEIQSVAQLISGGARLRRASNSFAPLFIEHARGAKQCEKLWQVRREFSYSLRDTGLTKLNQDVVVPRGKLEDIFALGEQLQKRHGFPVACFGHAGDGNIHVNIMVDFDQPNAKRRSDAALDDLFQGVLALGGAITGEHGIGLAKKRWWPLATTPAVRALHAKLKSALDPAGILNPGKFV